ncbi:MAG: pyrroline-5-carboxylate reductase, partial [Fimbriimonadaceae bacterium]|nr:pyrroline-5-carboxylate reductase [Fimbriimonadaceae bacterium]
MHRKRAAMIGGGNMGTALLLGLIRSGWATDSLLVIEPLEERRRELEDGHGIPTLAAAGEELAEFPVVVWAVKPQSFREAAEPCAGLVGRALHLSVMAGIRCADLARAAGTSRIIRSMPNTPALIGAGVAGVYADPSVTDEERLSAEGILTPTGQVVWVDREEDLDAVTALSGSGPAYVFYFMEAMLEAAAEMGLPPAESKRLVMATFRGAAALADQSGEEPQVLRAKVTSKGGTTHAACT